MEVPLQILCGGPFLDDHVLQHPSLPWPPQLVFHRFDSNKKPILLLFSAFLLPVAQYSHRS